ncbi:MAG: 2-amino-4-hydroxy-6-hydroxymethyldihydropteridine diphosphokinase [Magnetococcales bacterium]|nr:2-amino-4-hydroxy-6-hydroxymethyldihydropteridine diphosphokinase [Magnetococcales bacterium]MBF0115115.1 2-amino-4-hydroxy-6-hydroxymethyldihydropteridine diphosphokinase [Magnetococcales bacterium]
MIRSPILIAFGSNIDPLLNVQRGLARLQERMPLLAVSTVYHTQALPDPAGGETGAPFLNGAVEVVTDADPLALKGCLRSIEEALGRDRRGGRFAPRTLDLDIALMGDLAWCADGVSIPDPDMMQRSFLAIPLAELAPDWLHPVQNLTLRQIADRFKTPLPIDRVATDALQRLLLSAETGALSAGHPF